MRPSTRLPVLVAAVAVLAMVAGAWWPAVAADDEGRFTRSPGTHDLDLVVDG